MLATRQPVSFEQVQALIERRVRCTLYRRKLENLSVMVSLQRLLFRTECALHDRIYS